MQKRRGLLRYNDLLVIILIALIGASLTLTALVGVQFRERTEFSETERLSYRNQLVQLQLEYRIAASRRRLVDAARDAAPGDRADMLRRLNAAPGQLPGTTWHAFEPDVVDDHRYPRVTLYRDAVQESPRGAIFLDPVVPDSDRYHPVLLVDLAAVAEILRSDVATPSEAVLVDGRGNEIVTVELGETGPSSIRTHWDGTGIAPTTVFHPHLGAINRAMTRPAAIHTVHDGEDFYSVIPLPGVDAYLGLRDVPIAPPGLPGNPVASVVFVGVLLYAVIVVLFVSYRRLVMAQTTRLAALSEQKNLLFSLLSHNLKNDLAAISAEAHGMNGGQLKILTPVAEASRTISNSLYYVQFQEGTFQAPPIEPVDVAEIIEFLALRCSVEAAARSQTIRTDPVAEGVFVDTNLAMTLEALERIVINAIQYSPESSEIVLRVDQHGGAASLVIADHGPGLPAAAESIFTQPSASCISPDLLARASLRGIGLYVARNILETLGAAVRLIRTGPDGVEIGVTFDSSSREANVRSGR
jgi:two-component sensor histidine kinase